VKIPISKPFFEKEEREAVLAPLESGWVVQGPFVQKFEAKFAAFARARFAVATSSCTAALHTAVAALGLKPGDEVIVPAFTWVSTANVVEFMGARPVFCDIDLNTYNVDTTRLASLITPRTVGIIPVHLFGLCADMDPILRLASRHHLWIVEDAACALGARYGGRHAGTFGEMGCFSFHPRKSITTGEGGMITTERGDLDRLTRSLRDHGASQSDLARHVESGACLLSDYEVLGYNYRMTDIQASLGCAQMERAEWILASRARLARRYDEMLAGLPRLRPPAAPEGYTHAYQAYVCLFGGEAASMERVTQLHEDRNRLMRRLEAEGIATRQGTHAPVTLAYYVGKYALRSEEFRNAYLADRLTLALPVYAQMTESEQTLVCERLRDALNA